MNKKVIIILIGVMLISFVSAAGIFISTGGLKEVRKHNYEIDKEFNFEEISDITEIQIKSVSADVRFILTDSNDLKVHAHGSYTGLYTKLENELITSRDNNVIIAELEQNSYGFFVLNSNLRFDIYIPRTYSHDLIVKSVSGDVKLKDMNLDVFNVSTVSGDIILGSVNAESSRLSSTSGDIYNSLSSHSGTFTIHTVSGDVEFEVIGKDCKLTVNTVSGDVEVKDLLNSSIKINTVSGDISTIRGFAGSRSDRHLDGSIGTNDRDNSVIINTTSGDVDVN